MRFYFFVYEKFLDEKYYRWMEGMAEWTIAWIVHERSIEERKPNEAKPTNNK